MTSSVPAPIPVQVTAVTTPENEYAQIVATVNTSHSIEKYPEDN